MLNQWIGTTLALALAFLAQHRLAHEAPPLEVGALFLAAGALAVRYFPRWEAELTSLADLERPGPVAGEGWLPEHGRAWPQRARRWLWWLAGLALAGALILAASQRGWPWDGLLWGLSLAAFVGALADRAWWRSLGRLSWGEGLALAAVLGLGLATRVYGLEHLPPAIHGDEAQFGLNARAVLRGELPTLFGVGWYQFPLASFAAQAGVMGLFGDNLAGLRLSSALAGTLSLLPVYLLARSMFDWRVALVSGVLMAVGHWPVHFSRLGVNNVQATFCAAWAIYLAWRALRGGHRLDYALTGLALGLGLYTYYAARLMPLIVGAMLLIPLFSALTTGRERGAEGLAWLRGWLANGLILGLAGLLAVAPQLIYYARHPEPLIDRQRTVFLFNNLPHLETVYHTQDWGAILRQQAVRSTLVFNARGDSSGQYGFNEPMLDRWTAGLLVVGLAVSTWRWRRGGHWVLHLWFWPNLLLGSILTVDAPFVPRLVALTPVPFIWAGLALGGWWRAAADLRPGRPWGWLTAIPVLALLGLVGWANYDAYINRYIRERRAMVDSTQAAHLLASLPETTQVLLLGAHNIYADFGTFRFMAPEAVVQDAVNVIDWAPLRQPEPPDTLFLVWNSQIDRLPYLEAVYPEGSYQAYRDQHGNLMFATYFVPAEVMRARQGWAVGVEPGNTATGEAPLQRLMWRGTLWLPEHGPRQFCLPLRPGEGADGAYLEIGGLRVDTPGVEGACQGLWLAADLPAGPQPVEASRASSAGRGTLTLYWRRDGQAWEMVPAHLAWGRAWNGGLLGMFWQDGTLVRREVAPLVAYRDLARELTGPVYATWTGCLAVHAGGEYEFRTRSFDGARLMLDEQFLIRDSRRGTLGEGVARIALGVGRHPVRLEATFTDGPRWLEWYWRPPGQEWALVPPQVLTPGAACGRVSATPAAWQAQADVKRPAPGIN